MFSDILLMFDVYATNLMLKAIFCEHQFSYFSRFFARQLFASLLTILSSHCHIFRFCLVGYASAGVTNLHVTESYFLDTDTR